jgi:hypothetical protein
VIKWLLMHLEIFGGKCVSSMKKCIFISLEKCLCTFFCEFFEVIFDCTCALAWSISLYAGIVYEHYCLCPGRPCARKSFKKVVYVYDVPWMCCETGHVTNCMYHYPCTRPPTIRPIVCTPQDIAIVDCHLVNSYWTTMYPSDINKPIASPPFREAFVE